MASADAGFIVMTDSKLDAPAGEQVSVLFLVCQTAEKVDVVLALSVSKAMRA